MLFFLLISVFLSHITANTFPWMSPNIQLLCFFAFEDNTHMTWCNCKFMISVSYCPWVFFDSLYLMKRLLWASFLLSMDSCLAGSHSEIWTVSLLWATSNLFSVPHVFSDSQNMLLFPYLPNNIMIDRQELLHCCSLPAPSFSFLADSEKELFFFLYTNHLFPFILALIPVAAFLHHVAVFLDY